MLKSLGQNPNASELQDMINELDADGNGTIDFEEFTQFMAKLVTETDTAQELIQAFKVFDKDGDGLISYEELRVAIANLGEKLSDEEIDEMLEGVDASKSITQEEFLRIILES